MTWYSVEHHRQNHNALPVPFLLRYSSSSKAIFEAGKVLRLGDMARSDNVIFSATGITKGDLLEGISRKGNIATTETLLIRGKSRTIRRIQSIHYLDRKDPEMQVHIL